jgi:hypothetical protein
VADHTNDKATCSSDAKSPNLVTSILQRLDLLTIAQCKSPGDRHPPGKPSLQQEASILDQKAQAQQLDGDDLDQELRNVSQAEAGELFKTYWRQTKDPERALAICIDIIPADVIIGMQDQILALSTHSGGSSPSNASVALKNLQDRFDLDINKARKPALKILSDRLANKIVTDLQDAVARGETPRLQGVSLDQLVQGAAALKSANVDTINSLLSDVNFMLDSRQYRDLAPAQRHDLQDMLGEWVAKVSTDASHKLDNGIEVPPVEGAARIQQLIVRP